MNKINTSSESDWAQSSNDMLLDRGFPTMVRRAVREIAVRSLYLPLIGATYLKPQSTPHLRIIFYHSIFEGDSVKFSDQLKFFSDNYDILPLGSAIEKLKANDIKNPTLSITFDDGYLNNFTVAAEILSKYDITACFYVTSDFIDIDSSNLSAIEAFCRQRLFIRKPIQNMTWDNLKTLASSGHEIGSHAISHKSLTALSNLDMMAEIQNSKSIIEKTLNQPAKHFSIPFGIKGHYSQSIIDTVQKSGYDSCVLGIRGANLSYDNLYSLRRDHCSANWSIKEVRSHLMRSFLWPKPI